MLHRLILVALTASLLAACGGSSGSSATYSQVPEATQLKIYGLVNNATLSSNCLYVTVDKSAASNRPYIGVEYTLDTQLTAYEYVAFPAGESTIQIVIPVSTSGTHTLSIRGVTSNAAASREPGVQYKFLVDYQQSLAAAGKYIGDRTVYSNVSTAAGKYSGMRLEFATYSATRNKGLVTSAGLRFNPVSGGSTSFSEVAGTGTAIPVFKSDPYLTFDIQMNSATDGLTLSGLAFNHVMELMHSQNPLAASGGSTGHMRLYRYDAGSKLISVYCNSLTLRPQTSLVYQAVMTMNSFDGINFNGHVRLWSATSPVWTYQLYAYNNGDGTFNLWPSLPANSFDDFLLGNTTYTKQYNLHNPPGAPVNQKSGAMTVSTAADGTLKVDSIFFKLNDQFWSDSGSIQTRYSYKP